MNVKIPAQLRITTQSAEMHDRFANSMKGRTIEKIAGLEFAVISTSRDNLGVTAHFSEVTRTDQKWTGEGRPPVGTVCEFKSKELHDWFVCEVMYLSRWIIVVDMKNDDGSPSNAEGAYDPDTVEFRPIRTPEQIAEEAKQKAVDVIEKRIMDLIDDLNVSNLAEDLFDLLGEMSKPTDQ